MYERRGNLIGRDIGVRTRVEDWFCGQATPQLGTLLVGTFRLRWRRYGEQQRESSVEPRSRIAPTRTNHRSAA
jgi:hypothetical protein